MPTATQRLMRKIEHHVGNIMYPIMDHIEQTARRSRTPEENAALTPEYRQGEEAWDERVRLQLRGAEILRRLEEERDRRREQEEQQRGRTVIHMTTRG